MSRSDAERVADILDSCRRLNEIASAGKDEFFAGEILQDAASYRLTVVGEALNSLSKDFAKQHPSLRIPEARGMRNRLSHEYLRHRPRRSVGHNNDRHSRLGTVPAGGHRD